MILRHVMQQVKDQNWLAVGIDFFIVIAGVFLGIQVANGNAERLEQSEEVECVRRLGEDMRPDIKS